MLLSYFDNLKSGRVILFIHGTAAASDIWEKQYKILNAANLRVVGVDLRGHGKSKDPGGVCTSLDHIQDLKETLEHLKIEEPVTIVGHSFGAVLALRFAEKHPNMVSKLLLVSLPAKVPKILLKYYKWLLGKPMEFLKRKINILLKLPLKKKFKLAICSEMNIVKQIWSESLSWDFVNYFPHVNCPIYLSVGRYDYIALKSVLKKLHKKLPNSDFKIFNWASHTCMLDNPKEFNNWLLYVLALPVIQNMGSIGR